MHNRFKRILSILLVLVGIVVFTMPASAKIIEYNGTGSGGGTGGGGGGDLTGKAYLVPSTDMNVLFKGFRFSIYDGDGNKKYKLDEYGDPADSLTIDILVKAQSGFTGIILPCDSNGSPLVAAQLAKKEWISSYSSSDITIVPNGTGRISYSNGSGKDSATGFDTDLPTTCDTTQLEVWIAIEKNQRALYELCGLPATSSDSTDFIIIEPLFSAKVSNEYIAATPTDFAMVGINIDDYGYNSYGTDPNGVYDGSTLGTIQDYTNRLFPNAMRTTAPQLGIPAGSYINSTTTYGNILTRGYGCNIVSLKDLLPSEYTDTIYHYMWGFKKQEDICTNDNKDAVLLDSTTFEQKVDSTFTLDTDRAIAPPNGFYCENDFGSSSIDGTWKNYDMGISVTQKAAEMSFEYDYQPYTYNITYEMNGGNDDHNSPTTYNVLYPVSFYDPTREGYDFLGWYDENGNRVYGVNNTEEKSNNNFKDVDDLYEKLSIRTTGDITVYARWAEISLHITQHGYTKYDTETIEGVPNGSTLTQELNSLIAGG